MRKIRTSSPPRLTEDVRKKGGQKISPNLAEILSLVLHKVDLPRSSVFVGVGRSGGG